MLKHRRHHHRHRHNRRHLTRLPSKQRFRWLRSSQLRHWTISPYCTNCTFACVLYLLWINALSITYVPVMMYPSCLGASGAHRPRGRGGGVATEDGEQAQAGTDRECREEAFSPGRRLTDGGRNVWLHRHPQYGRGSGTYCLQGKDLVSHIAFLFYYSG